MFFTCILGWCLTDLIFAGIEMLLYGHTFFHWGDIVSAIFWSVFFIVYRVRNHWQKPNIVIVIQEKK